MVVDLFNDFRDGSKLLDLLEVMSGQRLVSPLSAQYLTRFPADSFNEPTDRLSGCVLQSRERGRGMFQHRSNIEKALSFLKKKSVNDTKGAKCNYQPYSENFTADIDQTRGMRHFAVRFFHFTLH